MRRMGSTSDLNTEMCRQERLAGREAAPPISEVLELIW